MNLFYSFFKNVLNVVSEVSFLHMIVLVLYNTGVGIFNILMSLFNIPEVLERIDYVINFVFDFIFNSLTLLSFFIRPSTLILCASIFVSYYLLKFEFKFFMICFNFGRKYVEFIMGLIHKFVGFGDSIIALLGIASL